jgi:hypothetical protein
MIEYRICWSASSNITFGGETDWEDWDSGDATDEGAVERELTDGPGRLSQALEQALEASGYEWWVETRTTADA